MNDGINLKTCPFCGSEANHFPVGLWYYVDCSNKDCTCRIFGPKREDAIRMWNRRIGPWEERDSYKHRVVETIGRQEIHEVYYYDPPERIYTIWDGWNDEEFETVAEAIQFVRKMEGGNDDDRHHRPQALPVLRWEQHRALRDGDVHRMQGLPHHRQTVGVGSWIAEDNRHMEQEGIGMTDEQCPNRPDGLLCACWRGE